MKKVDYSELSNKCCVDCGRPLKQNLIIKNPDANRDYICNLIATGRTSKRYNLKRIQELNKRKYKK